MAVAVEVGDLDGDRVEAGRVGDAGQEGPGHGVVEQDHDAAVGGGGHQIEPAGAGQVAGRHGHRRGADGEGHRRGEGCRRPPAPAAGRRPAARSRCRLPTTRSSRPSPSRSASRIAVGLRRAGGERAWAAPKEPGWLAGLEVEATSKLVPAVAPQATATSSRPSPSTSPTASASGSRQVVVRTGSSKVPGEARRLQPDGEVAGLVGGWSKTVVALSDVGGAVAVEVGHGHRLGDPALGRRLGGRCSRPAAAATAAARAATASVAGGGRAHGGLLRWRCS